MIQHNEPLLTITNDLLRLIVTEKHRLVFI